MADQGTSADQSTTTSLSGAPNESQRSPRRVLLWRWLGYFAVFAIAWHVTNFISIDEAEEFVEGAFSIIVSLNMLLFVVLLIHGGWRVLPAACGGLLCMLTFLMSLQVWDGISLDAQNIWDGTQFAAPFGLVTGGIGLLLQRDHGKLWRAVARFLLLYGLVMTATLLSLTCRGIADEIGRNSVNLGEHTPARGEMTSSPV